MTFAFWDPAGDEPVYASRLNAGSLWEVDDIAELEATDATDLPTNSKVLVQDDGVSPVASLYLYNKSSSDTADGFSIVEPDVGGGRYFRQVGSMDAKQVNLASHGFTAPALLNKSSGDIRLIVDDGLPKDVTAQTGNPVCAQFNAAGTKLFVMGSLGIIYQYSTSVAHQAQGASYDSVFHDFGTDYQYFCFNSDDSKIYLTYDNGATEAVEAFSLGTPGTIASVGSSLGTFDPGGANPRGLCMSADETRIYVVNNNSLDIREITLGTADDITTASSTGTFPLSPEFTSPLDLALTEDGLTAYLLDSNTIYECTFGTAGDIDTFGTPDISFSTGFTTCLGLSITRDASETRLVVTDDNSNNIETFTRSVEGWELADASNPLKCMDTWFLTSVVDSSNFIVTKTGTVTISDHGLRGASNPIFSTTDVDDTDWQSTTITQHTWGSAQKLQGIVAGDWIRMQILPGTGHQSINTGVYPITAVDASGLYLRYNNPSIDANTYDLTGLDDTNNRITVYGAGKAGDVLYASEVPGYLSPFPANGGHVELPVATIIDANTVRVHCPVGIPPASQNRVIAQFIGRSVSAITNLLGHQRASMLNPQNWKLKVSYNVDDESSHMRIRFANATHKGGEKRRFDSATPAIDNSTSASTFSESAITRADLELEMDATGGADRKSGWGMLIFDGELLHWESQGFSDDGSFAHMAQYYRCDMREAVLSACGVGATAHVFDITIQRMT